MNRIYRLVWNRALRVLQVASELAHAPTGGNAHADAAPATGPRRALALACAAALLGLATAALPAHAAVQSSGGNGGNGAQGGSSGGSGGSGAGAPGNMGSSNGAYGGGGGGGGPGAAGGNGGTGGGTAGGTGGSAGTLPSGNGANGANGAIGSIGVYTGGGGGGGGGGATGFTTSGPGSLSATVTGGNGGNGGYGGGGLFGGGGGGGAGGYGARVTASFALGSSASITGGNGGSGGRGQYASAGGTGGAGASLGGGVVLTNGGSIRGGNGGSGGADYTGAPGISGAGGAGIVALGGGVTIVNSGSIAAGQASGGGAFADAIDFGGGGNTLELHAGSSIVGNVLSTSGATNGGDTLVLGGVASGTFDASSIVASPTTHNATPQYAGFSHFVKNGTGTWILTGNTSVLTPWTINGGILSVADDGSLGASSGGLTLDGGELFSSGAFGSTRQITIGAGGGIVAGSGSLSLGGAISGTGALSLSSSSSTISLGTANVASLSASALGGITLNGDVTTSNGQTYNSAMTLGANVALTDTGAGNIVFNSSLDGAHALSVTTAGTVTLAGPTGSTTALNSLALQGSSIQLGGNVSTTGAQSYTGATTLTGDATLSSGSGAITLNSALDGAHALTVSTSGAVTFGGALGATTALSSLAAQGSSILLGGNVNTTSAQTYAGAATLATDLTLSNSGNGGINFGSTLNGAHALTINTGGVLNFGAAVGSGAALKSLTTTSDTVAFNDLIVANDLTMTTKAGAIVQTAGTIVVGGNSTFTATNGAINLSSAANFFNGTVSLSTGGSYGATVNNGSNPLTLGKVSLGGALGLLGSGTLTLDGDVSFGGALSIGTPVVVRGALNAGSVTMTNNGSGGIAFAGAVDAQNGTQSLTVNGGSGGVAFAGTVGGSGALSRLTTTGSTFSANMMNIGVGGLLVTTTGGAIAQGGAFAVAGTSSFNAGNNAITLTNAGNSFGGAVSLGNSGNNNVALTNAGLLTLGSVNVGTGTLSLSGAGLGQSGSIVQAASADAVTLNAGSGAITLTNSSNDFTGAVTASGTGVFIHDTNDLTIAVLTDNGNGDVNLIAGGTLGWAYPGNGYVNAGTGNLTLASNGGALTTAGDLGGGNITLSGKTGITLASNVSATGTGTLDLESSTGNITQTGGSITANTLTGNSAGSISLMRLNQIVNLGAFSANGFNLTNAQALTVTGAVNGGSAISITTTAGALNLNGSGSIVGSGAVSLSSGDSMSLAGNVSGATVALSAPGAIVLTGTLGSTGGTTLAQGALQVGNGGTSGAITGNVVDNTALVFNRSDALNYAGALSGTGALTQAGSGTLMLDGNSSAFAGSTAVTSGRLIVGSVAGNGAALGGNVSVASGATLGGHGTIGGSVALASGAHLAPGNSIGTLTVNGNLTAAQGSVLDFEFGSSGHGDSVHVGGNLALNGATLNVTDVGGFGPGLYNLFTYGGTLSESNGGIALGTTPAGTLLAIQSLVGAKQINLLNATGVTLNFWNANGLASGTQPGGGSGSWSTTSPNWADASGAVTAAMQPQPGFAIFAGAAGTVSVDNSACNVSATGLQFASNGYTLSGGTLTLVGSGGTSPIVHVGDGSSASAGMTATINNVLAGTAGLTKTDLGTLVLTGANTYTGGTTINGGTLSVAFDTNLGAAAGALTLDGGTLRVTGTNFNATPRSLTLGSHGGGFDIADAGNSFAVAQSLGGSGALGKLGAGTLVLSGANTYTGGTTINGGTLSVASDTNLGAAAGALTLDGGTLRVTGTNFNATPRSLTLGSHGGGFDIADAGNSFTVAQSLGGSGALSKLGAGTLVLSGANSYSGGTTIGTGTLQGDTHSLQGTITDNAMLVFAQDSDGLFAGSLVGNGTLSKTGAGTLLLNGNNAFAGSTTVLAGTLAVGDANTPSAFLGGNVQVNAGGTLRGHGTIGGDVTNNGAVWPGGSIGTLTIQGNYTQGAGGVLNIDALPDGTSDRLSVGGKATINGSTVVLAQAGNWAPRTDYTILTAGGGVSGQFASASSSLAFLNPVLSYTTNAVNLSLQRNDISFAAVAQTPNQKGVATAAESLGWNTPLYTALVKLDSPTARVAFAQLGGEIHASTRTAIMDDDRYVREAINHHLLGMDNGANGLHASTASGVAAWSAVWSHWGSHDGDGNAAELAANGSGLLVGADLPVAEASRIGAVVGTGQGTARIDTQGSSSHVLNKHVGVYGSTRLDAFQLQAGAVHGWQTVSSNRILAFGDFAGAAASRYHADTTQAYMDGGYAFTVGHATLTPFANLAWERLHTDAIHEHGSLAALDAAAQGSTQTVGTLGLRGSIALGDNPGLHAHASVGWQHAWGDTTATATMRFASGGDTFDIAGLPVARNAAAVSGGISFTIAPNVSVDATYSGQFASRATDQSARMSLTVAF